MEELNNPIDFSEKSLLIPFLDGELHDAKATFKVIKSNQILMSCVMIGGKKKDVIFHLKNSVQDSVQIVKYKKHRGVIKGKRIFDEEIKTLEDLYVEIYDVGCTNFDVIFLTSELKKIGKGFKGKEVFIRFFDISKITI